MENKEPFKPNPKQLRLLDIAWNDPYVENLLAFGPSRSGKTTILTSLVVNRALAYPGTEHAIFRDTLRSCHHHLFSGTFPKVMKELYPSYLERKDVRVAKNDNVVEFHNGSKIFFEGLDPSRRDKVLGAEYATAWINECNSVRDYDMVQQLASRMAADGILHGSDGKPVVGPDGEFVKSNTLMLFDCNPDVKTDWEYKTFVEKVHPSNDKPFPFEEARKWRRVFVPALENAHNLRKGYLDSLTARYEGSDHMASRFLEGRWRDDNPNAMFRKDMFRYVEFDVERDKSRLVRIVVAIDPAGTSGNRSDFTGIVVVGVGFDGNAYVLDDASIKGTPEEWAKKAIALYDTWDADLIVAEKNYGGEMVEHTIRTARRNVPVKMVNATRSKLVRAEPVQMLYLQNKVLHTQSFKELEAQMCSYTAEKNEKSPDRMDALVWGLTEIMKLSGDGGSVTVKRSGGVWRA